MRDALILHSSRRVKSRSESKGMHTLSFGNIRRTRAVLKNGAGNHCGKFQQSPVGSLGKDQLKKKVFYFIFFKESCFLKDLLGNAKPVFFFVGSPSAIGAPRFLDSNDVAAV